MGEIDAIGDVVSGAMLAGAVEPDRGAVGADGHTHEATCLNCAAPLVGDYCHACGQHAHVHRTLTAFFHDLVHSVFHFEGKFWTTLPMLAWRPGRLTRCYIEGQRARFVSPMALFLFSVFTMFAVVGSVNAISFGENAQAKAEMSANLNQERAKLGTLRRERSAAAERGLPTAAIDERIRSAQTEVNAMRNVVERGAIGGGAITVSEQFPGWIREPVAKAGRNPDLLLYKLRQNAYKWSWALIPLSVPFLWLLFPFSRKYRLYDHMVFVTYSLSFMTLLVVTAALLSAVGWSGAVALAMFVPSIHMYRQLKEAYQLTWVGALWRAVMLTLFALTAALLFVMIIVGLGVFD